MASKKRYFQRNKKKVGIKSGKRREKEPQVQIEKTQEAVLVKQNTPEKSYFPNISRYITEQVNRIGQSHFSKLSLNLSILTLFFGIVIGIGIWQGILLTNSFIALKKANETRNQLSQKLALWDGIAKKYPTYRDAYFQSAVLSYQLGETEKEKEYLQRVLLIDPNYEPAKKTVTNITVTVIQF